jgi:hypothetical protein
MACGALAFDASVQRPDLCIGMVAKNNNYSFHFILLHAKSPATLVFDCLFRVAKGDVYTAGLKYNHTAIYRQKAAFYTKFIETSLEHGSFNVAKTEINGFGPGPDIQLSFRIYLDMRKIQM